MTRSLYALLTLLLVAAVAVTAQDESRPDAVAPVLLPAPQTSVTSTAFNPALTNAGGTTNSAGTFNVQSLARSSSYAGPGALQQTTTYQVNPAPFASSASVITPSYLTAVPAQTSAGQISGQVNSATASSVSLINNGASVNAATTVNGALVDAMPVSLHHHFGLFMASAAFIVALGVAAL